MPLPEERRNQLDGIVNQMILNKESDETVQMVVNDFKTKYEGQVIPSQSKGNNLSGFFTGFSKGFWDLAQGLKQRDIGIRGLIDPYGQEERQAQLGQITSEVKQRRETMPSGIVPKIGEIAGGVAPTLPIPMGTTGRLAYRSLASMLTGAGMGFAQPTIEGESVTENVLMGGGTGAIVPSILYPVGKVVHAAKEVYGKGREEIMALAKKYKIPLSLGEITQNPIIEKAETWLEAIPLLGIKGFRIKQNVRAEQASQKFLGNYIVDKTAPDIMQANRAYSSGLFEDMKKLVGGIEKQEILPEQTRSVAKSLLERYPDIFKKFQDIKRERLIKDIVQNTEDTLVDITSKYPGFQARGEKIFRKDIKILTFEEAWTLRDGLGEMIGQARRQLARGEIDKTTLGELNGLFKAVNQDIESWATKIGKPEIKESIMVANNAYKQYVVKYDMIQQAVDKAEGVVGAGEIFSPKRLSTALKKISYEQKRGGSNLFAKEELDYMDGLFNIMQVAKRAGQFIENPPTGNRWGIPQMMGIGLGIPGGVAAGGSPQAALAIIGTEFSVAGLGKFLTSTEAGKRITLSASNIQPNSPMMLKILYDLVPKVASMGAVQE